MAEIKEQKPKEIPSTYILAKNYLDGGQEGATISSTNLTKLFRTAADAEPPYAPAQYQTAVRYAEGIGVEKNTENDKIALHYLTLAVDAGDNDARCYMGICYREGHLGLDTNNKQARQMFQLAAGQGHAQAKAELSTLSRALSAQGFLLGSPKYKTIKEEDEATKKQDDVETEPQLDSTSCCILL